MNRRKFFKYSASAIVVPNFTTSLKASEYTNVEKQFFPVNFFTNLFKINEEKIKKNKKEIKLEKKNIILKKDSLKTIKSNEEELNQITKVHKDIFLDKKYIESFVSVRNKLKLVQSYVGHGNFNIISFDKMIQISKYSKDIEKLTKAELDFLEFIFYDDPSHHGFYGEKVSKDITSIINKKDIVKISHTGHYLFRGESEKVYQRMLSDIGDSLVLTSGVRSVVKQTKLFLDKIDSVDGNLTVASKSLAPPAYTYHSIADFDVGKKGFGYANFTPRFALTQEFMKMRKLKYIDMRYTINNKDGVRYEPWHVKVI